MSSPPENAVYNQLIIISILLVLTITLSACGLGAPGTTEGDISRIADERDAVTERILALVGDAPCDAEAQCGALPMGHLSCGGPASYLPYSSKETNTTELFELADQHAALSKELNERSGKLSVCIIPLEPTLQCENNSCVAQAPEQVTP